jgi:hypothetical protein
MIRNNPKIITNENVKNEPSLWPPASDKAEENSLIKVSVS